jgi:hypothetical protein
MTTERLTLDDIKNKTIEHVLYRAIETHQILDVVLPDGAAVLIYPKPDLKPLPVLEGFIPSGWKDAIYDHAQ